MIITLGETRDFGMEHVDSIDFMLKSTFCQLSIDCSLMVFNDIEVRFLMTLIQ